MIGKLPLGKKGLKIKPSELYNPNGVAIADAIVRVNIGEAGGFGTGEFVSGNGLILTNHHVGFDALVSASTPEKDYATNGYKADSTATELPAKAVARPSVLCLRGSRRCSGGRATIFMVRWILTFFRTQHAILALISVGWL